MTLGASTSPQALAADEDFVYWRDWLEHRIYRASRRGGVAAPTALAEGQLSPSFGGEHSLAVDADYVCWTTGSNLLRRHKPPK